MFIDKIYICNTSEETFVTPNNYTQCLRFVLRMQRNPKLIFCVVKRLAQGLALLLAQLLALLNAQSKILNCLTLKGGKRQNKI